MFSSYVTKSFALKLLCGGNGTHHSGIVNVLFCTILLDNSLTVVFVVYTI